MDKNCYGYFCSMSSVSNAKLQIHFYCCHINVVHLRNFPQRFTHSQSVKTGCTINKNLDALVIP